jgi:hypothetical protein
VPTYIPAMPIDPYSEKPPEAGKPFGYRLAADKGEELGPLRDDQRRARESVPLAKSVVNLPEALHEWAELRGRFRGSGMAGMSMSIGPPSEPVKLTAQGRDGILWSIGADGQDNGGHSPVAERTPTIEGQDWIIVVPTRAGKQ